MIELPSCSWCDRSFRARRSGGRVQRFCRPSCRRAFHTAVRAWALGAIENGTLTVADIKDHPPTTCALPGALISPPPRPSSPAEAQKDLSDFGRLLDEMNGILGEPTIPLLIRLHWLARDRQKDHAAVVHGLCRFVGHVLDISRNARP
jgi:hypothetical protein